MWGWGNPVRGDNYCYDTGDLEVRNSSVLRFNSSAGGIFGWVADVARKGNVCHRSTDHKISIIRSDIS